MIRAFLAAVLAVAAACPATAQDSSFSLIDLSDFRRPPANWQIVGDVFSDRNAEMNLTSTTGTGVLANLPSAAAHGNLVTAMEHGDIVLDLEYLMPKGSNSGIYLQGRYEVQLLDSWGTVHPRFGDAAGIYQRWDESRPEGEEGYEGVPPRFNTSRAPGLWQHLRIEFQAPRFDDGGSKISNARFVRVVHNGITVHEHVEVTGPTRGPSFPGEAARGPIVIQGDHGPIAFRNMRFSRVLQTDAEQEPAPRVSPIHASVDSEPYVLRGMIMHDGRKRTHGASVGFPAGVHFSLDLSTGELLKAWKGPFIDATPMWYSRGEDQLIVPRGSTIDLEAGAPIVGADSALYTYEGYRMDEQGRPVFMYGYGDVAVEDRLHPIDEGRSLQRELTFRSEYDTSDLWVFVAEAETIERLPDGAFAVGDRSYYVEFDGGGQNALIEDLGNRMRLTVPAGETSTVVYRIIW